MTAAFNRGTLTAPEQIAPARPRAGRAQSPSVHPAHGRSVAGADQSWVGTRRCGHPFGFVGGAVARAAPSSGSGQLRVIPENESGLVIKKFGAPLPAGRLIALDGEAGYQARLLPPGWHFVLSALAVQACVKVPLVVVPPGEIALVVAADGAPIPPERILGARGRLRRLPGRRGVPAQAAASAGGSSRFLTAGTYRINPALFEVVTARHGGAPRHDAPEQLRVQARPAGRGGHRHRARRASRSPPATSAGPPVAGTTASSAAQAFIDAGGCRGLQEEVLLAGSWNLNPWFVQVELIADDARSRSATSAWSSATSARSTSTCPATTSRTATSSSAGSKGVWVEPLLPGQAPAQHAGDEGRAGAHDQHRAELGARAPRRTSYDEQLSSITVRSQGRLLVHPRRRRRSSTSA